MKTEVDTVTQNEGSVAEAPTREVEEVRLRPTADVYRGEDGVRILLDVPGTDPSNVNVEVHDGVLSIEARATRGDREVRVYERSFRVDRRLDVEGVEAGLRNGVLALNLPVHEEAKPRKIEVKAS